MWQSSRYFNKKLNMILGIIILSALIMIGIMFIAIGSNLIIEIMKFFGYILTALCTVFLLIWLLVIGIAIVDRKFINKSFDKNYTTEDMFWNGSDIKQMLIGKKIRIDDSRNK